ncbi:hypothetical protein [Nocardioides sp. B-3]|uniref:hypothetical protein n=1 Tax=Nocardioides sp. B-3 TaxID=2895565 RepID=UPI002152C5EE|nr:hypothetical protein [Nocardioides sp. B-3]UUZ60551.1 hypothetical protein LP418_06690 [Nocardioides sp. B-3]
MKGTPNWSHWIATPARGLSSRTTCSGVNPAPLKSPSRSVLSRSYGEWVVSASYISSWSAKLGGAFLPSSASRPGPTVSRSVASMVPLEPGGRMLRT